MLEPSLTSFPIPLFRLLSSLLSYSRLNHGEQPQKKDASYLYTIKPKPNKPLHDYLGCFNKAMLEISMLKKRAMLQVVKWGVLAGIAFLNSISKIKPASFKQFKDKAQKYIVQEDSIKAQKKLE